MKTKCHKHKSNKSLTYFCALIIFLQYIINNRTNDKSFYLRYNCSLLVIISLNINWTSVCCRNSLQGYQYRTNYSVDAMSFKKLMQYNIMNRIRVNVVPGMMQSFIRISILFLTFVHLNPTPFKTMLYLQCNKKSVNLLLPVNHILWWPKTFLLHLLNCHPLFLWT